ncbi:MAG TPA: hypothetical protein VM681_07575 [Candidatus Thermoplasmatota archaeon]|nr:hypothetical protein [Candidatus Thermoplasmatota archaeon]
MGAPRLALGAIAMAAALSGCLAADDRFTLEERVEPSALAGVVPKQAPQGSLVGAQNDAPTWDTGDWWEIQEEGQGWSQTTKFVVVSAAGAAYTTAATDREAAKWDAIGDNWLLGAIDKRTLGPIVQGRLVPFYEFPLEDNKTWTVLSPSGVAGQALARATDVRGPAGSEPGFVITVTFPSGWRSTYDYTPSVRFHRELAISDPDGNVVYTRTVRAFGSEYQGPVYYGRGEEVLALEWSGPAQRSSFQVPQGAATLFVWGVFEGTGANGVTLIDPAGNVAYSDGVIGTGARNDGRELPPTPGTWTVLGGTHGQGSVRFYATSVEIRESTFG